MALLEKCLCCSLSVAASVIGVYTLIAYLIALSMELWWIFFSGAYLPLLVYILCAVYFLIIVLSGFLLRGLSSRKPIYLLAWLVMISILSFPEAVLVLFMSIYYWKVHSLYGLTELTCWICRVVVNVAGIITIQSLYSTWKEENSVFISLQDLHMKSLERPRRISVGSSDAIKGSLGFQNASFSGSHDQLDSAKPLQLTHLKRSASSASQYSLVPHMSTQPFNGSLPYGINNLHHYRLPRPTSPFVEKPMFIESEFKSPSEFNASNFDLVMINAIQSPMVGRGNQSIGRAQSMVDLSGSLSNVSPRKAMSVVDYPMRISKYNSTQSLDRRMLRDNSVSHLGHFAAGEGRVRNAYFTQSLRRSDGRGGLAFSPNRDYILPSAYSYINTFYPAKPKANSRTSLGNESDDFQKYRDVAL